MNRTRTLRLLRIILIIIVVVGLASYASWRSLAYARGPVIIVFEPVNGSSLATSTALIRGRAERVSELTLNGMALSIDEAGNFSDAVILFPGINLISLAARDQFGRSARSLLSVISYPHAPAAYYEL